MLFITTIHTLFFEIVSLKHFAIFTGRHLRWGLFLINLQAVRPATFSKSCFPGDIAKFLRTGFL